jgi:hypothetical protein
MPSNPLIADMSVATTECPRLARTCAVAIPMPRAAPVMKTLSAFDIWFWKLRLGDRKIKGQCAGFSNALREPSPGRAEAPFPSSFPRFTDKIPRRILANISPVGEIPMGLYCTEVEIRCIVPRVLQ